MSNRRLNPRRDSTEPAIVAALERAGCRVYRLNGHGLPDLLVRVGATWVLFEVKAPGGRQTPGQVEFMAEAELAGAPVGILTTAEQAIAAVNAIRAGNRRG